jgi:DUF438 domain-containing protein
MELTAFYKSIVEQDRAPVVICNLEDEIIYMNPSAIARYTKWGGAALIGKSILDCHNENSRQIIREVLAWFTESRDHNIRFTYHNEKENKDVYMVALRDEAGELIGYYEKQEYRNLEVSSEKD